jgi:hypothetical protein
MASQPDFWLIECDTFWLHVPPAIACTIIAGPAEMMLHGGGAVARSDRLPGLRIGRNDDGPGAR